MSEKTDAFCKGIMTKMAELSTFVDQESERKRRELTEKLEKSADFGLNMDTLKSYGIPAATGLAGLGAGYGLSKWLGDKKKDSTAPEISTPQQYEGQEEELTPQELMLLAQYFSAPQYY